jgi:hypothetical protein
MTILEQEIVEHLRKLDQTQQEQVLAYIQSLETPEPIPNPDEVWTDEEIEAMMEAFRHPTPKTGAEIVAMIKEMGTTGWEHIEDSVAWVEEQRRKQSERYKW